MDLKEARQGIDSIDREMVRLFCERMELCRDIAEYKRTMQLPLTDAVREQEKLSEVAAMAGEEMGQYAAELYSRIFEISKAYQARILETR